MAFPPLSTVVLPLRPPAPLKQLGKQIAREASEKFMKYSRQFMTIN